MIKCDEQHISDSQFAAYRDFILDNYSDTQLSQTSIADHFRISCRQMNRLFRSKTGMSTSDFILDARMKKAASLLVDSDMRAAKIAVGVGIGNVNYFYTLFRKRYGVTPKQYRIAAVQGRQ